MAAAAAAGGRLDDDGVFSHDEKPVGSSADAWVCRSRSNVARRSPEPARDGMKRSE